MLICSWILFVEVLNENKKVTDGLVVPWICFYAIASVVSLVAITLKVRVFVEQLRERRNALVDLEDEETGYALKLKSHRKKLVKATRTINLLYASMMIGIAECIPLGVLQSRPCACSSVSVCLCVSMSV